MLIKDFSLKEEANKQAYHKFEKLQKPASVADEAAPTERFDSKSFKISFYDWNDVLWS